MVDSLQQVGSGTSMTFFQREGKEEWGEWESGER